MGAWGAGAFENDDAMDWVALDLEDSRDAGPVVGALRVAEGDGYLEAPEGSVAIAAAEVVAALAGRPGTGLPEEVEYWVRERDGVERETVELAAHAVGRVRNGPGSELRELWEEAGQPEEWYGEVDGLLARLGP